MRRSYELKAVPAALQQKDVPQLVSTGPVLVRPLRLGVDCDYTKELRRLQIELVKLQEWVRSKGHRVAVVFEGRDGAGKGGCIKRITDSLNPRICRVVALGTPTDREKTQWYFQRYVEHLPAAGEIVLFDRSWYNRAGVERVMGFCNEREYVEFLQSCPDFERMLTRSGLILIKYWFSVSEDEQERRFQERLKNPAKRWKLSPMDLESRSRWIEYSMAKDEMFAHTDIRQAPWYVIDADDKNSARLNVMRHLLAMIPYEDLTPKAIKLPPLDRRKYVARRAPIRTSSPPGTNSRYRPIERRDPSTSGSPAASILRCVSATSYRTRRYSTSRAVLSKSAYAARPSPSRGWPTDPGLIR